MSLSIRCLGQVAVCGLVALAWGAVAANPDGGEDPAAKPQQPDTTAALLCNDPEARAFDFWIGEWDVLNRNRRPDGVRFHHTGRATTRVHAVVGGCAIVEHWRGDAIGSYVLGFSIRAYDRRSDDWVIVLLWPTTGRPSFGEMRGGFRHGRGEFSVRRVTAEGDTVTNRFVFSDIRPDSLRWENGTSRDGGLSWVGNWIMEFSRRPMTAPGLPNGPTMTARRCPGEAHRAFDAALGEWQGTRTDPGGDTTTVRTHVIRILEGCAVVERSRSLDGTWEAFRVRAWEPDAERWVEYAIDSERRALVRREAEGTSLIFSEVGESDRPARRWRWDPAADGAPGWVEEERQGTEGPWRRRSVLRFDRPLGTP